MSVATATSPSYGRVLVAAEADAGAARRAGRPRRRSTGARAAVAALARVLARPGSRRSKALAFSCFRALRARLGVGERRRARPGAVSTVQARRASRRREVRDRDRIADGRDRAADQPAAARARDASVRAAALRAAGGSSAGSRRAAAPLCRRARRSAAAARSRGPPPARAGPARQPPGRTAARCRRGRPRATAASAARRCRPAGPARPSGRRRTSACTPAIDSESVTTSPSKPSSSRSTSGDDLPRHGRRHPRVDGAHVDVAGHDRRRRPASTAAAKGARSTRRQLLAGARLHRQRQVAVLRHRAVPGEVLEHRHHAEPA